VTSLGSAKGLLRVGAERESPEAALGAKLGSALSSGLVELASSIHTKRKLIQGTASAEQKLLQVIAIYCDCNQSEYIQVPIRIHVVLVTLPHPFVTILCEYALLVLMAACLLLFGDPCFWRVCGGLVGGAHIGYLLLDGHIDTVVTYSTGCRTYE
jgi:hypothetical protein